MDRSPRSICQLQCCVRRSSRGYRIVVYRREHPRRLEIIQVLAMDSRKTYIFHHCPTYLPLTSPGLIAGSGKSILRYVSPPSRDVPIEIMDRQAPRSSRTSNPYPTIGRRSWLIFTSTSKIQQSRTPTLYYHPFLSNSPTNQTYCATFFSPCTLRIN